MAPKKLKEFLDKKVDEYNQLFFIHEDPVSVPHYFSKKQDIEIAAFFASIFAWGKRAAIIKKAKELMALMDNAPHDFCIHCQEKDLKKLSGFRHRTFNTTDLLYFVEFFRSHYSKYDSLEMAFTKWMDKKNETTENGLNGFYHYFFSLDEAPARTKKHIASPEKKSSCKRLNMFLRWMVRKDSKGVDFGIWKNISPSQLVCPVDLHVARVARRFGLLEREQANWPSALQLTAHLRTFDRDDPVKYDFALFGLGAVEHY
ncbi:MAG: TIGR02757 family protein [Bacteroidetes bacterium]|nr:TIGR02757 family protein [Bacteroidota bacterium]